MSNDVTERNGEVFTNLHVMYSVLFCFIRLLSSDKVKWEGEQTNKQTNKQKSLRIEQMCLRNRAVGN